MVPVAWLARVLIVLLTAIIAAISVAKLRESVGNVTLIFVVR